VAWLRQIDRRDMFRDERGQGIDVPTILGVIGILVAVIVGALVYAKISDAMKATEGTLQENIRRDVDSAAKTIFTLLPILVLVAVVLSLFVIFRPAAGGV